MANELIRFGGNTRVPPELSRQIEILSNPPFYPGAEPDDPGFRLAPPEAIFHPAAQALLERELQDRQSASREEITAWMEKLSLAIQPHPTPADFQMILTFVLLAHEQKPFARICWSDRTCVEAAERLRFWPGYADLAAYLFGVDAAHRKTIAALDAIANSKLTSMPIARESTVPYALPPPPAEPDRYRDAPTGVRDPQPPVRTTEEQLKAMGFRWNADGGIEPL